MEVLYKASSKNKDEIRTGRVREDGKKHHYKMSFPIIDGKRFIKILSKYI